VGKFENGYVTYHPDNYFGGQLVYDCNAGYTLTGDKVRICEGDGWWSGSSPTCHKEIFCQQPPVDLLLNAIPNIQVNNQSKYKVGTEVEYQCDIGFAPVYDQESSNKIVCNKNGEWSQTKFKCASTYTKNNDRTRSRAGC
jgi:hypothetical protein